MRDEEKAVYAPQLKDNKFLWYAFEELAQKKFQEWYKTGPEDTGLREKLFADVRALNDLLGYLKNAIAIAADTKRRQETQE